MKHLSDPAMVLMARLFASVAGQLASPQTVAARAARRMSLWPRARAAAMDLARRRRRAQWMTLEMLALTLESEGGAALLVDALLWGARFRMSETTFRHRGWCWFCWKPASSALVDGEVMRVCSDHRAHTAAGRRLIRIAKRAGGWEALREEVREARWHARYDAMALEDQKVARAHDRPWLRAHQEAGLDPFLDDHLAILAVAWERVSGRYATILRCRPTAGRPPESDRHTVCRAQDLMSGGTSLRAAATVVGMSPATLSRRLRKARPGKP